jgi:hypothetical protein
VAVLGSDLRDDNLAKEVARLLTHSAKLRVLDTSSVAAKPSRAPADLQKHAREIGADLMVVVNDHEGWSDMKVVEVKTGVLLASQGIDKVEPYRSVVESAAEKWER